MVCLGRRAELAAKSSSPLSLLAATRAQGSPPGSPGAVTRHTVSAGTSRPSTGAGTRGTSDRDRDLIPNRLVPWSWSLRPEERAEERTGHRHGLEPEGPANWLLERAMQLQPQEETVPRVLGWCRGDGYSLFPGAGSDRDGGRVQVGELRPDTDFAVRCRAHSLVGYGPFSAWRRFRMPASVPCATLAPIVEDASSHSVSIRWGDPVPSTNGAPVRAWRVEMLAYPPWMVAAARHAIKLGRVKGVGPGSSQRENDGSGREGKGGTEAGEAQVPTSRILDSLHSGMSDSESDSESDSDGSVDDDDN